MRLSHFLDGYEHHPETGMTCRCEELGEDYITFATAGTSLWEVEKLFTETLENYLQKTEGPIHWRRYPTMDRQDNRWQITCRLVRRGSNDETD